MNHEIKKKIIVFLAGGTGNQLFQLMACENIARLHNRLPFYSSHLLGGQRKLETESVANKLGIKKIEVSSLNRIKIIEEINISHPALFSRFPDLTLLPNEDFILVGYFQNHRLHSDVGITRLREYAFESAGLKLLPQGPYIAIHLRELLASRGQLPLPNIDNLSINYYKRALSIIESEIKLNKKPTLKSVLLFTDMFKDLSKSSLYYELKNFLELKGYQVKSLDKDCKNSFQVISLISRAKYVVCSNSTFSWWGAYLSKGLKISPIFSIWQINLTTPDDWIQVNDGNMKPKTWHNQDIYNQVKIKSKSYSFNNIFLEKLKSVLKQKIISYVFCGLINKFNTLKIKSILS